MLPGECYSATQVWRVRHIDDERRPSLLTHLQSCDGNVPTYRWNVRLYRTTHVALRLRHTVQHGLLMETLVRQASALTEGPARTDQGGWKAQTLARS